MSNVRAYLAVALGGAIGAPLRHLVSVATEHTAAGAALGTFIANISGAFLLGYLATRMTGGTPLSLDARRLVTIGILGSYTTLSTFSYQTFAMIEDGNVTGAMLNSGGSLIAGLVAVSSGVWVARYRQLCE